MEKFIVASHGVAPEKIEDIPDVFGAAGSTALPCPRRAEGVRGESFPPGRVKGLPPLAAGGTQI